MKFLLLVSLFIVAILTVKLTKIIASVIDDSYRLSNFLNNVPELKPWIIGSTISVIALIAEGILMLVSAFPLVQELGVALLGICELLKGISPFCIFMVFFLYLITANRQNKSLLTRFILEWVIIIVGCFITPIWGYYKIWKIILLPIYGFGYMITKDIIIPMAAVMILYCIFWLNYNRKSS